MRIASKKKNYTALKHLTDNLIFVVSLPLTNSAIQPLNIQ